MKTIYCSACKNGKEIEGQFSTLERAEADLWANNYYLGCIVEESVSDYYFDHLVIHEQAEDLDDEEWMQESTLDKFRTYLKGVAA